MNSIDKFCIIIIILIIIILFLCVCNVRKENFYSVLMEPQKEPDFMTTCCNNYFFICNEQGEKKYYLKRDKVEGVHNLSMIQHNTADNTLANNPPYLTFGDDDNTHAKEQEISTGFRIELNPDNTFNIYSLVENKVLKVNDTENNICELKNVKILKIGSNSFSDNIVRYNIINNENKHLIYNEGKLYFDYIGDLCNPGYQGGTKITSDLPGYDNKEDTSTSPDSFCPSTHKYPYKPKDSENFTKCCETKLGSDNICPNSIDCLKPNLSDKGFCNPFIVPLDMCYKETSGKGTDIVPNSLGNQVNDQNMFKVAFYFECYYCNRDDIKIVKNSKGKSDNEKNIQGCLPCLKTKRTIKTY